LHTTVASAEIAPGVGLEVLTEDNVIRDNQLVDTGSIGRDGPIKEETPVARVLNRPVV
jgi:hypothetical protein